MQNPFEINPNTYSAMRMYFLQRTYIEVWAYLCVKNVFDCTLSAVRVYLGECTCFEVWAYLCVEVCLTALWMQYACTWASVLVLKYGRACALKFV